MNASAGANLAVEPEWRREVSSKLQAYRVRRRGAAIVDLQTDLPFDSDSTYPSESVGIHTDELPPTVAKSKRGPRRQRHEQFEITIPKLDTVAVAPNVHWPVAPLFDAELTRSPYSGAPLLKRRRAALVDGGLLLFSYGGMLALFTVLGGRIGFNKLDLSVSVATLALFYAQYFALFTIFGGSTPGMMLCGMRVVSFDGNEPTSRQMIWRSFGYIISAGSCFLGFVWALWDDDQLCWHDRISQTYLMLNEELASR
jgi:uncharacterized RDD family membrane protein YckC